MICRSDIPWSYTLGVLAVYRSNNMLKVGCDIPWSYTLGGGGGWRFIDQTIWYRLVCDLWL